jgi:uncharacterized membrane protein YozB (DUF420 family)
MKKIALLLIGISLCLFIGVCYLFIFYFNNNSLYTKMAEVRFVYWHRIVPGVLIGAIIVGCLLSIITIGIKSVLNRTR